MPAMKMGESSRSHGRQRRGSAAFVTFCLSVASLLVQSEALVVSPQPPVALPPTQHTVGNQDPNSVAFRLIKEQQQYQHRQGMDGIFGISKAIDATTISSAAISSTMTIASNADVSSATTQTTNALVKASAYTAETLGNIVGPSKAQDAELANRPPPTSVDETIRRIEEDLVQRQYFFSGDVDVNIYEDQCLYADPFTAFRGRDRFVNNLSNLSTFVSKYKAEVLSYEQTGNQVQSTLAVQLEVNLPWKPILAWNWGVRYDIDPNTYLVTDHIETWDVEAAEGIAQIFRKPTTTMQ